jgi:PQQ-dependent catabolism-associated CXXCW motif protein
LGRTRAVLILSTALYSLVALPASSADQEPLFTSDGFRISHFLAPAPESVPGATTVSTAEVQALVANGEAALIDVLPAPRKPEGLPSTSLWLPPVRRNIPGSVWLPNVGYGRLSDDLDAYFRRNLAKAAGGVLDKKIVIYCQADCWMSWNAAKRAAIYGYKRVYWYPEGTTGWEAAGLPLAKSEPAPMGD